MKDGISKGAARQRNLGRGRREVSPSGTDPGIGDAVVGVAGQVAVDIPGPGGDAIRGLAGDVDEVPVVIEIGEIIPRRRHDQLAYRAGEADRLV